MYVDNLQNQINIYTIYKYFLPVYITLKKIVQFSKLLDISIKMYYLKVRCALSEVMVYILRYILLKSVYCLLLNFQS